MRKICSTFNLYGYRQVGPGAKGMHQVSTKLALSEHQVLVLAIAKEAGRSMNGIF
jgi:hypothetical protein